MDFIPKVDKIIETANTPEVPKEPFKYLNQGEVYRAIVKYYNEYTDLDPLTYTFEDSSGDIHSIDTTLYDPDDMQVESFSDMTVSYSNHSLKGIKKAGLDIDEIWNGDSSIVIYEDGELKFGYTDYYTSKIFTRLLYIESANALLEAGDIDSLDKEDFNLRNDMLQTKKHFYDTPAFSTGSSSGGVIMGQKDGEWRMLLGRRSNKPRVNQGMVSVVPNGGVEYEDYDGEETFSNTVRREFSEEAFNSQQEGIEFFAENVDEYEVSKGWNMRSGSLAVGFALYTSPEGYERIQNTETTNFEFSELVEVPIRDFDAVTDTLEFGEFSPSTVAMVCRCLEHFDAKDDTPSLPYSIAEE